MKLSYHTYDLLRLGINLGLLLPDGRVATMDPNSFPGAEELYSPDNPIKVSVIKDIKWTADLKTVVYILDEDVVKVDDPDHVFGKLCLLVPEDKLNCMMPIEDCI